MKHVSVAEGQVTKLEISELNHNVAIVTFNLWPALLVLRTIEHGARRWAAQSSQVAMIASLAVFSLATFWRRQVIQALAVLWCVAFVLVLPLDFLAYRADLHMAAWLPSSFRARVIIWDYTAERVLDHPWLGIGADSTPSLREPREQAGKPEGFVYPRNTGRHAHAISSCKPGMRSAPWAPF